MKKEYQAPSAEWVSFQINEALAADPNISGGAGNSPFSMRDEGYTMPSGDYSAE